MNPPDGRIRALLGDARRIAVVGASSDPGRPSHGVMGKLMRHGYTVVPVNPNEREVHGLAAVPHLRDVHPAPDVVVLFRRSSEVPPHAQEAIDAGARVLWMQSGVWHDGAARRAAEAGLDVVMDRCIGVDITVLGVPRRT